MDVYEAYKIWADQYDSNVNKTRDLEALSLRATLADVEFDNCLEIGCGTGKNTEYLLKRAKQVTAVDFSDAMLAKARQKIQVDHVQFIQADITSDWTFANRQFDLVTFSLVLEHIECISDIFEKLSDVVSSGGLVYIGELHPFKQYTGSKARFETDSGQQIVTCFNHHISEFVTAAKRKSFDIVNIAEYFDNDDKTDIPRIITFLFRKT